ncbi:MAG: hypothetical protein M3Q46_14970 [Verrucomicrobiota bacterium]|nr:hypothetical protein [Verrucomicrobiota bacterium]
MLDGKIYVIGGTAYSISAERGRLTSTQPGGGIY